MEGRPWRGARALGLVLIVALVVGLGIVAREPLLAAIPPLVDRVRSAGAWGVAVFVGVYVVATVLFAPGAPLTAAAGFLWGVPGGTLVVSPASVLGATLAFVLARGAARPWVERWAADDPRLAALDRAVGQRSLWMVLLLRLSPLFPFNLLNYALGLTSVRLWEYVLGSFIGMLPGTVLYVWLGSIAAEAGQIASGQGAPARAALLAIGLAATAAVVWLVNRTARRALLAEIEA
jgi:uncharacterized membrane protein YdjX (TVP38/TMEM64 family)